MTRAKRKYFSLLEKKTYEELEAGRVKVTDRDGATGIFSCTGPWIEGDLTEANINMLIWTGGETLAPELNYRWNEVPVDVKRASGWPKEVEYELEVAAKRRRSKGGVPLGEGNRSRL